LSTVINITPRDIPAASPKDENLMFEVIEASFGQRRKTLVNALSSGLNLNKEKIAEIVKKIAYNENIRGEELDIKAFCAISDLIFEITDKNT
jgi:16S rRNA (adenine1518-N6/adenine1519-N6)-dimethyltransferase